MCQQVASGHSITRLRQSIKVHCTCTYGIREVYSTGTYQREDLGSSPTGNVDGEYENFLHMHCLCVKHIRSYETTQCEYLDNITAERMSHTWKIHGTKCEGAIATGMPVLYLGHSAVACAPWRRVYLLDSHNGHGILFLFPHPSIPLFFRFGQARASCLYN